MYGTVPITAPELLRSSGFSSVGLDRFRQAKIEDFCMSLLVDDDVRGLYVAVDKVMRMRFIERSGNLQSYVQASISAPSRR
jgi:hypothetical protein